MPTARTLVAATAAALAVVLSAPVPAAAQDGAVTLNVLTWNIQGSKRGSETLTGKNADAASVVGYLRDSGAEYIGLQEVSADDARTIADGLGWGTDEAHLRTAFEHGFAIFGTGAYEEGIAMLSKYPMTSDNEDITPSGRGRRLQHAVINKNGVVFHAYNTHLGSDDWSNAEKDADRNQQATWVRDRVQERERTATELSPITFLGGDMNSHPVPDEPNSAAYQTLHGAFSDSWLVRHPSANEPRPACDQESGCTITIRDGDKHPRPPDRRIDYFFVDSPQAADAIRRVDTPPPPRATEFAPLSDHLPYQMVIGQVFA